MIRAATPSSWQNRCSVSAVDRSPVLAASPFVAVVSAGDPGSSRLVYAMVIGLAAVGVGLTVLAFWILRQTRPDLEVLAPLERMDDRDWKKRDPSTQRRMLDEVRPPGAQPLATEPPPPSIDSDFDQAEHDVASFSDLGPGLGEPEQAAEPDVADSFDEAASDDAEAVPDDDEESVGDGVAVDEPDVDALDEDSDVVDEEQVDASGDESADDAPAVVGGDSNGEPVDGAAEDPVDDSVGDAADEQADEQADEVLSDPRG